MQAASIIISEPEADLKEMAKRLGFSNVGALMRKFKREHGCTIEEYRATNFAKSRAGRPKS
jgi:AraC-like DNA-binding protein